MPNKVGLKEGFKYVKGTVSQINTDKIHFTIDQLRYKI